MDVDVRVGNYHVDSSNFISGGGFRGFLGSDGTVGIDRDYDSLRQDLWLATDQAYKQALDLLSGKRAFLRNLANAPTIDDFSQEPPMVMVEPRQEPDWTNRNWEAEAKQASAAIRAYPQINGSRVVYRLTYTTTYLMTSEGTQIRTSRSLASIEAGLSALADDGTPVHNYLALYANRPSGLAAADSVRQQLDRVSKELVALRAAPRISDYDGPVLFEAPAADELIAQLLGPSLGGARPLLSANPRFDQMQQSLGGRSEWSGRMGQRVMPAGVSVTDDPTAKDFQGQELIGSLRRGSGRRQSGARRAGRGRPAAGPADVAPARSGARQIERPRAFREPVRRPAHVRQSLPFFDRREVSRGTETGVADDVPRKRTAVVFDRAENG